MQTVEISGTLSKEKNNYYIQFGEVKLLIEFGTIKGKKVAEVLAETGSNVRVRGIYLVENKVPRILTYETPQTVEFEENYFHASGKVYKGVENTLAGGKTLAKFTIISGFGSKSAFLNCTAWEKMAEIIEDKVGQGDRISVSGRIKAREYNNNIYVDFVVRQMEIEHSDVEKEGAPLQKEELLF